MREHNDTEEMFIRLFPIFRAKFLRFSGIIVPTANGEATPSIFASDNTMRYGWRLRLTDFPRAIKNITLLPAAWGEKKSVTSSSKKVRPEAPRPWA